MSLKPRRIDFEAVWQQLSDTVSIVICGGGVARPVWNDRFSDVYAVCVANPEPMADKLYSATKNFLEAHVRELYKVQNLVSLYFKFNYLYYEAYELFLLSLVISYSGGGHWITNSFA